jgi:hypothetical protein
VDAKRTDLPQDRKSLEAILRSLMLERANKSSGPSKRVSGRMNSMLKTYACNSSWNGIRNGITGRARIG